MLWKERERVAAILDMATNGDRDGQGQGCAKVAPLLHALNAPFGSQHACDTKSAL